MWADHINLAAHGPRYLVQMICCKSFQITYKLNDLKDYPKSASLSVLICFCRVLWCLQKRLMNILDLYIITPLSYFWYEEKNHLCVVLTHYVRNSSLPDLHLFLHRDWLDGNVLRAYNLLTNKLSHLWTSSMRCVSVFGCLEFTFTGNSWMQVLSDISCGQ